MLEFISFFVLVGLIVVVVIIGHAYVTALKKFEQMENKEKEMDMLEMVRNDLKQAELPDLSTLQRNPTNAECLKRFYVIKKNSNCLFARNAKLWGSEDWDYGLTLEENILKAGKSMHLDGFLFEVRGNEYFSSIETFGQTVRRVLTVLSEADPSGINCMKKSFIGKRGWYFEFDKESIFLTTFAPCYPSNHSRFCYHASEDSCWILIQPEYYFAWKELGADTPLTNWENPQTMRDKIRCEFKKHNQLYEIPNTVYYPPAHHVVKPLEIGMPVVEWWIKK